MATHMENKRTDDHFAYSLTIHRIANVMTC